MLSKTAGISWGRQACEEAGTSRLGHEGEAPGPEAWLQFRISKAGWGRVDIISGKDIQPKHVVQKSWAWHGRQV